MLTPQEIATAQDLRARMDSAGYIDDRPAKMCEMMLLLDLKRFERQERVKSHGCCCEEGPDETGRCRGRLGKCPRFELAAAMLRRAKKG